MAREPYSWQDAAVRRHSPSDGAALFLDMRLGKSLIAARLERMWRGPHRGTPTLLVAPTTPLAGWMDELDEEGIPWRMASKVKGWEDVGFDGKWVLATPSLLTSRGWLQDAPWACAVADESTWMRNPKSQASKAATRRLAKLPRRIALTGLPNPEGPQELWPQMAFVMGGGWMGHRNFWSWRQEHFQQLGYDWVCKPASEVLIRDCLHRDATVLSRRDVGKDQRKVRERLTVKMTSEQLTLTRQIHRDWRVPGVETKNALEVGTWLRRIAGGHAPSGPLPCDKYRALVELLVEGLRGEQVVVWFAFNEEILRAWRELKAAGVQAAWLQGTIDAEERRRRCADFRAGRHRVMLAQVACGKYGANLSSADTSVYFSGTWSCETRQQTEDRVALVGKAGKDSALLYVDILVEGSADEAVLETCQEKGANADFFLRKLRKVAA